MLVLQYGLANHFNQISPLCMVCYNIIVAGLNLAYMSLFENMSSVMICWSCRSKDIGSVRVLIVKEEYYVP